MTPVVKIATWWEGAMLSSRYDTPKVSPPSMTTLRYVYRSDKAFIMGAVRKTMHEVTIGLTLRKDAQFERLNNDLRSGWFHTDAFSACSSSKSKGASTPIILACWRKWPYFCFENAQIHCVWWPLKMKVLQNMERHTDIRPIIRLAVAAPQLNFSITSRITMPKERSVPVNIKLQVAAPKTAQEKTWNASHACLCHFICRWNPFHFIFPKRMRTNTATFGKKKNKTVSVGSRTSVLGCLRIVWSVFKSEAELLDFSSKVQANIFLDRRACHCC